MGGLFSKPKSPPPVPPPPAIPEVGDEQDVSARRRARGRSGFRQTVVTGSLQPAQSKKALLG